MKEIIIKYKGKEFKTKVYKPMSDELFLELRKEFYKKPSLEVVKKELYNILYKDRTQITNIKNYFFKDLMAKTKIRYAKWSVEDAFTYKPILEHFYGRVCSNEKVFSQNKTLIGKFERAIAIAGAGVAKFPTNFKLDVVKKVLDEYNVNDNYLDTSCGWGVRLLGALAKDVNYFGIEPNYELVKRLNQVYGLYKEIKKEGDDLFANDKKFSKVDIRCQGSEIFIPEWENKMGVAFTSPPYFDLEDYQIGNQSIKLYSDYNSWLQNFYRKTIENTYRYLIKGGYMLINIKNFKNYNLEEKTVEFAKQVGFVRLDNLIYENIKRCQPHKDKLLNNNENIFVFQKI